jgi:hypothetical protein
MKRSFGRFDLLAPLAGLDADCLRVVRARVERDAPRLQAQRSRATDRG